MGNNLKIPFKTAKQVIQDSCQQRSKGILPIKTGLREKQVLQDPGYVKGVKTTCCMLHAAWYVARLYKISYVKGVERNKKKHNTVDLRHLSLMSKESKFHSIYNVDSNSKYSN